MKQTAKQTLVYVTVSVTGTFYIITHINHCCRDYLLLSLTVTQTGTRLSQLAAIGYLLV